MIETALWLLLAVVMYFAGRYDLLKEIESGVYGMEYLDAHRIRLTRVRHTPAAPTEEHGR